MQLPHNVVVKEVGPRDGLQNESAQIATADKVALVERLADAGFRYIEVSSFVHPKWIPALADAADLFQTIKRRSGVEYSALVPNVRGLERALSVQVDAVNVFMSASESHNRKNINKSIDETFPVLKPVIEGAKQAGLPVRGYVSTVFGCPYEGNIAVDQVRRVSSRLLELGVDELSLGDTIGVAVPSQVYDIIGALEQEVDKRRLALHFHDTRGTAIANIWAGLMTGVTTFDASVGGLGGCPYAPGASGNVATEDVLYLMHKLGLDTGIDEAAVLKIVGWFESIIGRPLVSHGRTVARAAGEDA